MKLNRSRPFAGIFRQLGFTHEQTLSLHRTGRRLGHAPAAQVAAIAAASLRYTLAGEAAATLGACNHALGVRCEDIRCRDEN